MAYETLVAVYDAPTHADAAVKALKAAGFAESDISLINYGRLTAEGLKDGDPTDRHLWQRLFGSEVYQHEADIYGDTVQNGGVIVSVRVPDNEVVHATAILNLHMPVDVHDRALTVGAATAAHVDAVKEKIAAVALAEDQKVGVSAKLAAAHPDVLRLAEEHLEVGKTIQETGRTRVRRFVTEKEAEANVTLHDEHAEVIRTVITKSDYAPGDIVVDWADQTIEVVETAEHALVNKTARVVEEVQLKKIGADHVETIHEKLRRQQVEIERLGPDGKPLPPKK